MDVVLDLHGAVADLSYMLILLHIAAAIYSRIKGEGVWSSMVPVLKETGPSQNKIVQRFAEYENMAYEKIGDFLSPKNSD